MCACLAYPYVRSESPVVGVCALCQLFLSFAAFCQHAVIAECSEEEDQGKGHESDAAAAHEEEEPNNHNDDSGSVPSEHSPEAMAASAQAGGPVARLADTERLLLKARRFDLLPAHLHAALLLV